ncbi:uncharacterized protein VTP21DRAFT_818 [Calcarisporiella thermophila]|uniref:uncharacterized protein n=1 Tax=Calcarisporiella thermophila TaxID=911321 RepID=UPI003742C3F9
MLRAPENRDPPRFRPFPGGGVKVGRVKLAKYATSLDPRGYIPVYEYQLPEGDHTIMWDRETGEVHFTGIWKALGNSKADIVKMVDSNPELNVKKIRGGFLKIQGTWIQYEYAKMLARRTCFVLRKELVPLFGPDFPASCLHPSDPGFGCLLLSTPPGNPSLRVPMISKRRRTSALANAYRRASPMERVDSGTAGMEHAADTESTDEQTEDDRYGEDEIDMEEVEEEVGCGLGRGWGKARGAGPSIHSPPLTPTTHPGGGLGGGLGGGEKRRKMTSPRGMEFLLNQQHEALAGEWRPRSLSTPNSASEPLHADHVRWSRRASTGGPAITFLSAAGNKPNETLVVPSKDWIDTVTATLLLQKLSQDDGKRPFRPWHETELPRSVFMGNKEFTVVWSE